jgi:phospholipid/cholesterol/gamma-HCH transport system permease protein
LARSASKHAYVPVRAPFLRRLAVTSGGFVTAVGSGTLRYLGRASYTLAVTLAVLRLAVQPNTWRRTVRDALARQILFSAVDASPFTVMVAFLVGISVVVQVQLWLGRVGQSQLLGPVLVAVVLRELGPLLANMIVIGRSGNAIAAELGHMRLSGEVRVLDAQGLDPLLYLVLPRALATMTAVLCLTVIFIVVCLLSGYWFGWLLGARTGGIFGFLESVARATGPWDVFNVVAKSLAPGLLAGVICSTEGLSVADTITDVPTAIARAVQWSVVVLFFISALISLVTYL